MKMTRRVPRPADLAPLMRFRRFEPDARKRRLSKAHKIADLRDIAKRRTPKGAFDYTDGAAELELSLARARQAFEDVEFHPAILRDVSQLDTSVEILGGTSALPFGIAPTGFTRMMHAEGERAGASAAGAAGIPFSLSTLGTTSPEGVAVPTVDNENGIPAAPAAAAPARSPAVCIIRVKPVGAMPNGRAEGPPAIVTDVSTSDTSRRIAGWNSTSRNASRARARVSSCSAAPSV